MRWSFLVGRDFGVEGCTQPSSALQPPPVDLYLRPKDIINSFLETECWDCPSWERFWNSRHFLNHIDKCCVSPPFPQLLASASYDDTVKLYREEEDDWVCYATLEGHESTVWSLAFDPSGQRLASCSDDRTVRIWRQYLPDNEQGEGPVRKLKETPVS